MTYFKLVNGERVELTPEEVAALETEKEAWLAGAGERKAKEVRQQRDRILKECDWTQVADAPVDQAAWATYRQALRDIPQQEGFPENVVWPEKP